MPSDDITLHHHIFVDDAERAINNIVNDVSVSIRTRIISLERLKTVIAQRKTKLEDAYGERSNS